MKISVIGPVLNEVDFIGYSIMAALPFVHEFVYALDANSNDGTRELLRHIKDVYAHEKLTILDTPAFHPSDMKAYNWAFNVCISRSTGDHVWFLHPDMVVSAVKEFSPDGKELAFYTQMTSYARDLTTVITKGRADKWKNIHAKKFGLIYYGGYGSQNEDFYHTDVTGKAYKHFGSDFSKYPYRIANSGIEVNHYCELKDYKRRLEKMKLCLKTLYPTFQDERIEEMAIHHPRVTLEDSSKQFGDFEFSKSKEAIPPVFNEYKAEFSSFKKELVYGN